MTRSSRGFTLIEVLVGLVLLAAFIGGIYTVVVGSLVAKRKIDETAATYTAGPKILDLIERDLRHVLASGVKDNRFFKAQKQSVGGRDVTTFDMVTTTDSKVAVEVDDELTRSDVTEVGYRLKTSEDEPDMLDLYRREQFLFDDELVKGGQYYLVYDRVRSLKLSFFEDPNTGKTTSSLAKDEGFEEWDSEDKGVLPQAVKIELVLGPPAVTEGQAVTPDTEYRFVRWVTMPTAFDKAPQATNDQENGGNGGNGGGGGR